MLEDRHSAIRSRGNERWLTSGEVDWCAAILSAPWNGVALLLVPRLGILN